jgi:hypothetical protein
MSRKMISAVAFKEGVDAAGCAMAAQGSVATNSRRRMA